MMISPDCYIGLMKDSSYQELISERDKLLDFLKKFERDEMAGDRSDPSWNMCPKPDVRYQMDLEYLAALCRFMQEKYNQEYIWGDRMLKQDAEEKSGL